MSCAQGCQGELSDGTELQLDFGPGVSVSMRGDHFSLVGSDGKLMKSRKVPYDVALGTIALFSALRHRGVKCIAAGAVNNSQQCVGSDQ